MDLVCLGLAVIDARRVDPHGFDSAPHERACGVEVESGKVQLSDSWRTGLRRAEVTRAIGPAAAPPDRKSTRLNSSHQIISYAVFCLKKKKKREFRSIHK